jgi:hypothetical protein
VECFYEQVQRGPKGQVWHYFDSFCKKCRVRYQSERRRQIKRKCVEYLGGECQKCQLKTDRVEVYDFHHPDPDGKDFTIGKQAKSFEALKAELDKCVLLCANCHRLAHGTEV